MSNEIQTWHLCKECGTPMLVGRDSDRQFCSRSCSTRYNMRGNSYRKGKPNPNAIESMRLAHLRPEVAEAQSKRSSEFFKALHATPGFRPGVSRDRLPVPQKTLLEALGLNRQHAEVTVNFDYFPKVLPKSQQYAKADILHPESKTVIEVDGESHRNPRMRAADKKRTEELQRLGYEVIRFWNGEVMNELERVVESAQQLIDSRTQLLKGQRN